MNGNLFAYYSTLESKFKKSVFLFGSQHLCGSWRPDPSRDSHSPLPSSFIEMYLTYCVHSEILRGCFGGE